MLKHYLLDAAKFSLLKFKSDFDLTNFRDGFKLESKYSREDVFRILGWKENPTALNVGGYLVSRDVTKCPIFINYHKDDSISDTTKYEDQFIDARTLIYMSKNKRTMKSPDVFALASQPFNQIRVPIFVKKNNDEGLSFYYVGDGKSLVDQFQETRMTSSEGEGAAVVRMLFELDKPVSPLLFKYLTSVSS
jgi:hypothetical protein